MAAATTQLTDLVYGAEYTEYAMEKAIELNSFIESGIAVQNGELDQLAAGQGGTYIMPFFKQLSNAAPLIATDDDTQLGARQKITSGKQKARLHMYAQIWSSADLTTALIAKDPITAIADQTAHYWATWSQKMMLASAVGVYADNLANDGADMIVNISTITDANGGAAARCLQDNTLIDAAQTMGDHKKDLVAIAIHSAVHARLQKLGALQDHHDMETGALLFQTFQGKRVIIDDGMPVDVVSINDGSGASNKNVYTSVVFGSGAFQLGTGLPKKPTAAQRDERAGNGGGVEDLVERRHKIVHPVGFEWLEGSVAGLSATEAELKAAANWSRVQQRKNIKMAFIRSRLD